MTLGELDQLPATEYDSWLAYLSIEPPLPSRLDAALAVLTAAVYRAAGGKVSPREFYPDYDYLAPENDEDLGRKLMAIFGAKKRG